MAAGKITDVRLRQYENMGETPDVRIMRFLHDYPGATQFDILGACALTYTTGMTVVNILRQSKAVIADESTKPITYRLAEDVEAAFNS